jgi:outer membrane protein TolC
MPDRASQRLIVAAAILLGITAPPSFRAATADEPRPVVEALPAPRFWEPLPPEGALGTGGQQLPLYTNAPAPVLPPRPPTTDDRPLPINLPSALRLADARPIVIAAAQASVQVAAMQLSQARVLWLPNLNVGAAYYRHDGGAQGNSGADFDNARNQFMLGGGPYAMINTTDAYFTPLAARQVLRSRTYDVQAARNDALLRVAEAYFNVQQARGRLAGAEDSVDKARALAAKVDALAVGLVSPIETNRARTLLATLEQNAAAARGEWGEASAELTRALRLDPTATVVPIEPANLQITLISRQCSLDDLIAIGLTGRPELASQQALVQAALVRMREERMRPLMPSVLLTGAAVPTALGGYLMGGLFASSNNGVSGPVTGRNDVDLQLIWGLNNMGLGNRAAVRERQAEQRQQLIELFQVQDMVAAEVARAYAQLSAAAARVRQNERAVQQGQISYAGNVKGISETTRFGDLLVLVNRPQEVVSALTQLAAAYDNYFISINDYNRAQFRLYRGLGYPARRLAYDESLGPLQPVDTTRPPQMAPVYPSGPGPYRQ